MRIFLLSISLLLGGCAGVGNYTVNVDAISAPDALNYRTYAIVPGPGATLGLEFERYAQHIERALETKGMSRTPDAATAESVVVLGYAVGQAQISNYTTSIPQWGRTGYSGSQTHGTMVGNQYSSTTTYTPTYGITGYQQISGTITSYPLGIFLLAGTRDATRPGQVRELWQTNITAGSKRPDLRSAFPVMIYAATPYLAGDSGGMRAVRVPRADFPEAQ